MPNKGFKIRTNSRVIFKFEGKETQGSVISFEQLTVLVRINKDYVRISRNEIIRVIPTDIGGTTYEKLH